MKMYKNGKSILVDRHQKKIMFDAGWRYAPEEIKDDNFDSIKLKSDEENLESDESLNTSEEAIEDTTPIEIDTKEVVSFPKINKRNLKKGKE